MKTSTKRFMPLLATMVFSSFGIATYAGTVSAGAKTTREVAEYLAELSGKKASREFIETSSVELEKIARKCGPESMDVIKKNGLAAFHVFQNAGDDAGPYLINAMRTYGDDAILVAQTSAGRSILRSGSDAAIRAVSRHGDAAIPLIRQYRDESAYALIQLSPANGRRLIQMVDEKVLASDNIKPLMGIIGKYGNKSMEFIWKNRKSLATTALLLTFVNDPEPFINGSKDLVVGTITQPLLAVVRSIKWNLWIGILIIIAGVHLIFKRKALLKSRKSEK